MKEQPWHRRHAIILAGQLPKSKEGALLVLQAATRLVALPGFWDGETEKKPRYLRQDQGQRMRLI